MNYLLIGIEKTQNKAAPAKELPYFFYSLKFAFMSNNFPLI